MRTDGTGGKFEGSTRGPRGPKTAQIDWIEGVVPTALLDNSADGRGCTDGARKEDIRKHSTAGQALVLVDLLPLIRGKAKWMDLWMDL